MSVASSAVSPICTSPSAVSRGNSSSNKADAGGHITALTGAGGGVGVVCSEPKLRWEVVLSEHPNSMIRQIQSEVQRKATASIATSSESVVVGGGSDSSRASVIGDGAD